MNVVLLAYYYPPDPAVGGLRAAKVAAMFAARGDTVHVLAGPLRDGMTQPDAHAGEPIVHRLGDGFNPRAAYSAIKRRLRKGEAGASTSAGWVNEQDPPVWKRFVSSVLWLPDDRQGWIVPAVRAALPRLRHGASLVYTTAPPFSTHLAGLALKRLTGVRWAAEFRDPWTDNPWKPAHVRTRASDAAERWLERRVIRTADHVIAVSEGTARLLAEKTPARTTSDVIVARNGIDAIAPRRQARRGPVRDAIYVGNLYHKRDPRPFLAALASLNAKGSLPVDLRVRFVGECRWYEDVSLDALATQLGVGDIVSFVDRVPHDECQRMIAASDLLLLFAQDQPAQVPNKLYEYLGRRIPILAIVDPGGDTEAMLLEIGGHHIIPADAPAAAVERTLAMALAGTPEAGDQGDGRLAEWSSERQMGLLYTALEDR